MNATIPAVALKSQYESIRGEIEAALRNLLERQSFILGPEVRELEQLVAQKHGCAHAIGCASGSDALLLSLLALGVGPGDQVIVPAFTFFATAGSVARLGARPLIVDVEPRTFNISPQAVEQALQRSKANGPIKAIIPVHLYGQCADMDALSELAKQHHLYIVEDAAQAILARYREQAAGSMGHCGAFSFFPTKNLGGYGDGGMITTNDSALAERLRSLRVHGATKKYFHTELGLNSRLDNLQAAILLVKARHLDQWTEARRTKAEFYRTAFQLAGLSDSTAAVPTQQRPIVLPYLAPHRTHVYHQFTVRAYRRDELSQSLAQRGIETAVYYPVPLHMQPAFSYLGDLAGQCPESECAANEVLSLPIYPEITEQQQTCVVEEMKRFYGL